MNCEFCGVELEKGALLCPNCGTVVTKRKKEPLTKKELWELPEMKNCRINIRVAAGVVYASAVLSFLLKVTGMMPEVSLVEMTFMIGLALWVQIGRSRAGAVLLLLYGIANTIIISWLMGKLAGWWILAAGIDAVIYTFRFQKAWKTYQQEGIRPTEVPDLDDLWKKKK